jgi:hypothetical protein
MKEVDGAHWSLKKFPQHWRKREGLYGQPDRQERGEIESGERGDQSKLYRHGVVPWADPPSLQPGRSPGLGGGGTASIM